MSTSESSGDDAWKLLEEKEKDLEIAARIGQSLLELNRELKNRNDFLEESLNASNDTVVQLRHELQLRTNLLHVFAENEDEVDTNSRENVDGLQWRVKKLEGENESLRLETANLKKLSSALEEAERQHINECAKNLDVANEKISRLKTLLSEKSVECSVQNTEVERLLKVVSVQATKEKTLTTDNTDLREQIDETMMMYDELSKDYTELQERYAEVLSTLHEAEEELRIARRSAAHNRTASFDSLYDSLASELETSDSGLCSIINTARVPAKSAEGVKKFDCLQSELEDAVLSLSMQENTALKAADLPPEFLSPTNGMIQNGKGPCRYCNCGKSENREEKLSPSFTFCVTDPQPSTSATNFSSDNPFIENEVHLSLDHDSQPTVNTTCTLRTDDVIKSGSTDSLASYEGPKFGEPGKPGTRDLDYSLRKQGIQKEIEKKYARFRRERGLPPSASSFFSIPSSKRIVLPKSDLFKTWKSISSNGLVEPLKSCVSKNSIVSRPLFPVADSTVSIGRSKKEGRSQKDVTGGRSLRPTASFVGTLGLCDISRLVLPQSKFSSLDCLERSASLSLVGSLSSYGFSVQQCPSGIITRPRPST